MLLLQEVAVLAKCRSENITEYYASVLKPGSSELFIVMELMAASVADLVRFLSTQGLFIKGVICWTSTSSALY